METPDKATPQLLNKLANEYTKDVVRNPNGKIFDHIQAMAEGVPDIVHAVNSYASREAEIERLKDEHEKFRIQSLDAFEKQRERYEAEIRKLRKALDDAIHDLKAIQHSYGDVVGENPSISRYEQALTPAPEEA